MCTRFYRKSKYTIPVIVSVQRLYYSKQLKIIVLKKNCLHHYKTICMITTTGVITMKTVSAKTDNLSYHIPINIVEKNSTADRAENAFYLCHLQANFTML